MHEHEASANLDAWLERLGSVVQSARWELIDDLFTEVGRWRNLLSFDRNFTNHVGREALATLLSGSAAPHSFTRDTNAPVTGQADGGTLTVSGFFLFQTKVGKCRGFVVLNADAGTQQSWRAAAVVSQLEEIHGHPERCGPNRLTAKALGPVRGREAWSDMRAREREFTDEDPAVVVIGAGHSGLMIAARLTTLGVRTLIIERNSRVGDNWRNRYDSLTLHDPVGADVFPYLAFPTVWPNFTPKDKFADFLESYGTLMDLNVWTSANVDSIEFAEEGDHWIISVSRSAGERRLIRPRHLVIATGANDMLSLPDTPGLESFHGDILNARNYPGGATWDGKDAVVVGAGVTGHDIAQDLWEHGARVTLVQRSGTLVTDVMTFHSLFWANYLDGSPNTDDADLMGSLWPFGQLPEVAGAAITSAAALADADLLEQLRSQGFAVDSGPDGQGVLGLTYRRYKNGYYYNVGASNLIANGEVAVKRGTIAALTQDGVVLSDGEKLRADLVVFATGYRPIRDSLDALLGRAISQRVVDPFRVDDDELTGVWRRSGHDGLWLMLAMGILHSRFYSRLLGLQILATELGLMDYRYRRANELLESDAAESLQGY